MSDYVQCRRRPGQHAPHAFRLDPDPGHIVGPQRWCYGGPRPRPKSRRAPGLTVHLSAVVMPARSS